MIFSKNFRYSTNDVDDIRYQVLCNSLRSHGTCTSTCTTKFFVLQKLVTDQSKQIHLVLTLRKAVLMTDCIYKNCAKNVLIASVPDTSTTSCFERYGGTGYRFGVPVFVLTSTLPVRRYRYTLPYRYGTGTTKDDKIKTSANVRAMNLTTIAIQYKVLNKCIETNNQHIKSII